MSHGGDTWEALGQCDSAEKLAGALRHILAGEAFSPGDRLPTIRRLASLSGLDRNQVYRALILLSTEGWVTLKRGAGTFAGPRKEEPAKASKHLKVGSPRRRRIGIIPPGWDPGASHETVGALLHGIGLEASLRRHRIEVISAGGESYQDPAFAEHVLSLGTDGLIWIQPAYDLPSALVRLVQARLPLVLTGRGFRGINVPVVTQDWAALGQTIAECMVRYGRKRLACFVGCRDDLFTAWQVEGIRAALAKHGLELPDERLYTIRVGHLNRFYSHDFMSGAKAFLDRNRDLDALYSLYPDALEVLVDMNRDGRLRCPQDYIHLHYNRSSLPARLPWQDMPISFLEPRNEEVGRQAVRELETVWGIATNDDRETLIPTLIDDPRLQILANGHSAAEAPSRAAKAERAARSS